ncbi:hypothetical protein AFLA_010035 [Aspergillus flavus NRRL3357]|nr:hypothetical protein AFLA_010035 [Aspergillus flavus NRRL3357]
MAPTTEMIPLAQMPQQNEGNYKTGLINDHIGYGRYDDTKLNTHQRKLAAQRSPLAALNTAMAIDLWASFSAHWAIYSNNSPNQDHLLSLPKFNIQCAIIENTIAMGMTMEWMNDDDAVSIFNMQGPGILEALIPASLRPTIVQRRIPHHP